MKSLRAPLLALLLAGAALPASAGPAQRIVSVGGSVTEIVYALGQQDRLVARDSTSTYPEAAQKLPDVGYVRRLSPEGLLSVDPDLIIVEDGAGPPEAVAVDGSLLLSPPSIAPLPPRPPSPASSALPPAPGSPSKPPSESSPPRWAVR